MENSIQVNYNHNEPRYRGPLIRLLIAIGFWALLFVVFHPFNIDTDRQQEVYHSSNGQSTIGELSENVDYMQTFTAANDNLEALSFLIADYGRDNNAGTLTFTLVDAATGVTVGEASFEVADIRGTKWLRFEFPRIKDSKGKIYNLHIKGDSPQGVGVTMMGAKATKEAILRDGEKTECEPYFQSVYYNPQMWNVKLGVWIAVVLLTLLLALFPGKADEKAFLKLSLSFGLMMVLLNPFPHALDEDTHYFRSFMISQADPVDETDKDGDIGGHVSDNYDDTIRRTLSLETFIEDNDFWMQRYSENEEFFVNPYMNSYVPVNHALGAAGIWLARVLDLPVVCCVIFGRLTTLLSYVILCYFAIRKAKYYKGLFFSVAMLPLGISLASSFSVDPILIACSLLFTSICWKYYFDQDQIVRRHELVLLLVGVLFIAASKYLIYTTVLLQYFLIPRSCFKRRPVYYMVLIIAVGLIAVMGLTQVKLLSMFDYVEDRNGDVDMTRQIAFLLSDVKRGLGILAQSFFNTLTMDLCSMGFGTEMHSVVHLLILFILGSAAVEPNKYSFKKTASKVRFSLLMLFIFCLSWCMTVGALYVAYSPVGQSFADGVQARYLIPLLMMILFVVSCLPFKSKIRHLEEIRSFVAVLTLINTLASFLTMAFN